MPKTIPPDHLPSLLRPGMTVFAQSASSEPLGLVDAIGRQPEAARGVHFIACQIPGLNRTDFAGWHSEARFTGLFVTPETSRSYSAGKMRLMPLSYAGMYRYLEEQSIDLALIQVARGERSGTFTLGSSVHFVPAVLDRAKSVMAEVNDVLPTVGQSVCIDAERLDYVVPVAHDLPGLDPGSASDVARRIGAHIAGLVRDGDTVQIGIGKVPAAVLDALHGHRNLTSHGGLIGDATLDLHEAGALDPSTPLVCTSVIGTERVYRWVSRRRDVHVLPVAKTHDVGVLCRLDRFVAINSVLAIDLGGQANAETVNGRQVGGCGGLADFMRGAQLSKGGRSILALPSTAGHGKISRIVSHLGDDIVSCPRVDADYVVTEHGVADLRHKSLDERADALVSIADPSFHQSLADEWERRRSKGAN